MLRSAAALVVVAVALVAWDAASYDARPWLADYARIKHGMAQGYANLDWISQQRRVDLAALDRRTTQALTNAHSRVRAFFVLRDFVRAFKDPHLRFEQRQSAAPAGQVGSVVEQVANEKLAVVASCEAAGYEEGNHAFRFDFAQLPGWRQLADGPFPTGIAGDVGVLRIAQFGEDRYLASCRQVLRSGLDARALQLAVRARLQEQLRQRLAALQASGAKRLLVDVSGNGGGSEWVSDVIALMTDRRMSRAAPRLVAPACQRARVWQGHRDCPVFDLALEREELVGTGAWQGPVLILSDGGTASASEDFVAWLQQNHVATVIGERTLGAGCGYVDGGTRVSLHELPLDVVMPNCARFLEDGRNEIEGIAPDVPLEVAAEDAPAQLASLLRGRL
ncbi:hypothetical protein GCM10007235_30970 [Pseudoxanthomonas indica]|nr:hypothetical protein GCM10007235_30970 [Pseudoxanthomonas indica]